MIDRGLKTLLSRGQAEEARNKIQNGRISENTTVEIHSGVIEWIGKPRQTLLADVGHRHRNAANGR